MDGRGERRRRNWAYRCERCKTGNNAERMGGRDAFLHKWLRQVFSHECVRSIRRNRNDESLQDGYSFHTAVNREDKDRMNIWIVTDKSRGERSTSYRVFNSLTGQVVLVKKHDDRANSVFLQDSKTKIPTHQKRVIARVIDAWER
jgi:hypothetical protein